MTGPDALVLREFECGAGCETKFVALAGRVKILRADGRAFPVCDRCADAANEVRAAHGLHPLWED